MDVYYACEECENELHYTTNSASDPADTCPECGSSFTLHRNFHEDNVLEHCLICGGEDFYRSTQINPFFGVSMIVLGALGFVGSVAVFPGLDGFLWGTVVILSFVVFDRLLRMLLPEAVICYRCSSVYHSLDNEDEFEEFDHELATELKYSEEEH
jgi:predicted nucleic acid-binding Zn ribbon protein